MNPTGIIRSPHIDELIAAATSCGELALAAYLTAHRERFEDLIARTPYAPEGECEPENPFQYTMR